MDIGRKNPRLRPLPCSLPGQTKKKRSNMASIKELKESIIKLIGESSFHAKKFTEKTEMISFLEKIERRESKKMVGVFACEKGKYILGDPCYIALDVCDLETFNSTYYDPEDDVAEDDNIVQERGGEPRFHDGWEVAAALNTHFTSPTWCSDSTNTYSFLINSGVVCLMPLSYNPQFKEENAHVIEFDEDFECYNEGGVLHFGHIKINTKRPRAKSKESTFSSSRKVNRKEKYEKDDFVVDDDEDEGQDVDDSFDEESEYRETSDEEEEEKEYHKRNKKRRKK